MTKKYYFILFIPFILIGGCSSEDDKTTPEQSNTERLFDDQRKVLEKAKEVEQMLQINMNNRMESVDEYEQ
ncbi:MAG: hypothetical protein KAT04_14770 [Methylococcales bacterium]|nr:hypothetical protein [Methylococcales bacterium]